MTEACRCDRLPVLCAAWASPQAVHCFFKTSRRVRMELFKILQALVFIHLWRDYYLSEGHINKRELSFPAAILRPKIIDSYTVVISLHHFPTQSGTQRRACIISCRYVSVEDCIFNPLPPEMRVPQDFRLTTSVKVDTSPLSPLLWNLHTHPWLFHPFQGLKDNLHAKDSQDYLTKAQSSLSIFNPALQLQLYCN